MADPIKDLARLQGNRIRHIKNILNSQRFSFPNYESPLAPPSLSINGKWISKRVSKLGLVLML